MQKRALVVSATVLVLALAARPAEAGCGGPCPPWVRIGAYALGIAVASGYAYGTGYYLHRDLTHDPADGLPSREYAAGELTFNLFTSSVFAMGTVEAARGGAVGTTLVFGGLTALHGALAYHGGRTLWQRSGPVELDLDVSSSTITWVAGIGYVGNTLVWAAMLPRRSGRTYGIVEASVNAPIAMAMGYLAIERVREDDGGVAVLYGGLAALSGAFVYHGLSRALSPPTPPGIDLLGTDVVPGAVSDGHEVVPGLIAAGTW